MFNPSDELGLAKFLGLGVALNPSASHVGVCYRDEHGGAVFLHLAFHFRLERENLPVHYKWAEISDVDPRTREIVSAYLELVGVDPNVPYSFAFEGLSFDRDTGELVDVGEGQGLTCASFVSVVLASIGIELIDLDGWPIGRPDDISFHARVVKMLRDEQAHDHADKVEQHTEFVRVTPLEVGVAATLPNRPNVFGNIEPLVEMSKAEFAKAA